MERNPTVLALDVGSSWCKAALVDREGRFEGHGACWVRDELPFGHDADALERIWEAAGQALRQALESGDAAHPPAALAVAARKAPGIWLDVAGAPVGLPPDVVARAGRQEIDACYASPFWRDDDPFAYGYGIDLIGNTRWLWRSRPHAWSRIQRAGNLHTWLLHRMTGRWLTSHAGGPVRDDWPDIVWELSGLPVEAYPEVVPDTAIAGRLLPAAAADLGLPEGLPVATGTHDGAAANIGIGAVEAGDACLTFGTNGVLRAVTGTRLPGRFGYTITGERWALVRDLPDLSRLVDGVVALLDGTEDEIAPERHDELELLARDVPPGSNGLILKLFPDSPGISPTTALAEGHAPAAIYRASLEAVALGFAGLARQARNAGAPLNRYFATGGATNNTLLVEITSACLGAPIAVCPVESGLRALAAIAHTAAGHFSHLEAALDAMPAPLQSISAGAPEREVYATLTRSVELPAGAAPGDAAEARRAI